MNPEFRRMLWLEATPQRLWLIPAALLGAAFVLGHYVPLRGSAAMFGFVVLTILWGARQAANAVLDEVRERTWDVQRMSALSAWPMTWGKLLGATLMPWYAGLICLALYLDYQPADALGAAAVSALAAALLAIGAQALALSAALVGIHLERRLRARLNVVVVLLLLGLLLPELVALALPPPPAPLGAHATALWYGAAWDGTAFGLALLAMLAAWALLGAYRTMCLELQIRTTPWAWLAFIVFLAVLTAGFEHGAGTPALIGRWCSAAAVYACLLAYVAGFAFARDPVQYRRVLAALRERRYRRAVEDMPLWISSAAFALVFGVAALAVGAHPGVSNERVDNLGPVALVLVLMMLRDLCLLIFFSFRQRTRRSEVATLVWIALLNRIAPPVLVFAGLGPVATLLHPPLFDAPGFATGASLAQALVAGALASWAYRRAMSGLSPSADRRS